MKIFVEIVLIIGILFSLCLLAYDFDSRYPKLTYNEYCLYLTAVLVIGILLGVVLSASLLC